MKRSEKSEVLNPGTLHSLNSDTHLKMKHEKKRSIFDKLSGAMSKGWGDRRLSNS